MRDLVAGHSERAGVGSGAYPLVVTTGPGAESGGKSDGDPTPNPSSGETT
jgi:hypothetical protein